MINVPEFTDEATYADLFNPAMEIAVARDFEAAKEYRERYRHYLRERWERGSQEIPTDEEIDKTIDVNLGYYAGYYDFETRMAVKEVFGASHPIFGDTDPTPEEASGGGQEAGQRK